MIHFTLTLTPLQVYILVGLAAHTLHNRMTLTNHRHSKTKTKTKTKTMRKRKEEEQKTNIGETLKKATT
jgi:hypothetical protein